MEIIDTSLNWVLCFNIGDTPCAISLDDVREIVPMASLSKPPLSPSFVEGILNLAGEYIPVLRIDRILQLPEHLVGIDSFIVVTKSTELNAAFLADQADVWELDSGQQIIPYEEDRFFRDCFAGYLKVGGEMHHLISLDNLLLKEESLRMEEFNELEFKRVEALDQEVMLER